MTDHIFAIDGDRAIPTAWAAGPWSQAMMHGGAPAGLVVWAAERESSPAPMRVARLTLEMMRPVPLVDLTIETEILRQGRKIQLCLVRLKAAGAVVCQGQVLRIREADLADAERLVPLDVPLPDACEQSATRENSINNFGAGYEMRRAYGGFGEIGPGAWWFRQKRAMIAGATSSPAMLAASAADFVNGVGSALPFDKWTFLNADLSVNFARAPRGEWILNKAESWISADGAGVAMARLADCDGYFGTATQSLVIEPR